MSKEELLHKEKELSLQKAYYDHMCRQGELEVKKLEHKIIKRMSKYGFNYNYEEGKMTDLENKLIEQITNEGLGYKAEPDSIIKFTVRNLLNNPNFNKIREIENSIKIKENEISKLKTELILIKNGIMDNYNVDISLLCQLYDSINTVDSFKEFCNIPFQKIEAITVEGKVIRKGYDFTYKNQEYRILFPMQVKSIDDSIEIHMANKIKIDINNNVLFVSWEEFKTFINSIK